MITGRTSVGQKRAEMGCRMIEVFSNILSRKVARRTCKIARLFDAVSMRKLPLLWFGTMFMIEPVFDVYISYGACSKDRLTERTSICSNERPVGRAPSMFMLLVCNELARSATICTRWFTRKVAK